MFGTAATVQRRSGGLGLGLGVGLKGLTLASDGMKDDGVPLRFFDRFRNRYITFQIDDSDDTEARRTTEPSTVTLVVDDQKFHGIRHNTSGVRLKGFDDAEEVLVLGHFQTLNETTVDTVAGVKIGVNEGQLGLWTPSIEFPIEQAYTLSPQDVRSYENIRKQLLQKTLPGEDLPLLAALWETGRLEAFGLEFT